MNPSFVIRLSGWSLILGTATFPSGLIAYLQNSGHGNAFDHYNFYSRLIDQLIVDLSFILLPVTMLLLTLGVIGLFLRYGPRAGLLGKAGLVASITGGILTLTTGVIDKWTGSTMFLVGNQVGGWVLADLAAFSVFLLFGGIFAFGIASLKRHVLKRSSLLPIVAGSLIPVRIVMGVLQEATTDGWGRWRVDMNMINTFILTVTFICLIALGYYLLFDTSERIQPVIE